MQEETATTLFLGAEGCSELRDEPWLREATPNEIDMLREDYELSATVAEGAVPFESLSQDLTGRPYFLMSLTEDAPYWAKASARTHIRMIRLIP